MYRDKAKEILKHYASVLQTEMNLRLFCDRKEEDFKTGEILWVEEIVYEEGRDEGCQSHSNLRD